MRKPKPANTHFFSTAAAAEKAGYRPCLRCRPEIAPGYSPVDSGRNLAHATRELMDKGLMDHHSLEHLAGRIGITSRYMRRIFRDEFGVSPIDYNQSRRLLLAKQLLTDTRLRMTDIAMAAGFNSLARFNAVFREHYRMSPSRFRQQGPLCDGNAFYFELGYRPPYPWPGTLAFLRRRALSGLETAGDHHYRRVVSLTDHQGSLSTGWFEINHIEKRQRIGVKLSLALLPRLSLMKNRLSHFLDLKQNPHEIHTALADITDWQPGLRIPGCIDGFEAAVRAIAGQQITVAAATRWLHRFVDRFGIAVITPFSDLHRAFPAPASIASLNVTDIAQLGIIRQRAQAIIALARACQNDPTLLEPGLDTENQISRLMDIPGIGEWTAQYIALRALSHTDAFPASDVGVLTALTTLTGNRVSARQARALSESWRPWRGYMTLHLWNLNQSTHDRSSS